MNFSKHCDLCDYQKVNLTIGTTCGLTNLKPTFKDTCVDINLDLKLLEKLKVLSIEVERTRRKKL